MLRSLHQFYEFSRSIEPPLCQWILCLYPWPSFNAVPCKPSLGAWLSDTQESLQAVLHKTNAVVLVPEELVSFSSVTWRSPLTSVTEDKVVVLLGCCWPVGCLLVPAFDFKLLMLLLEGLAGKTFLSVMDVRCFGSCFSHLSYTYGDLGIAWTCVYHANKRNRAWIQSLLWLAAWEFFR